MMQVSTFSSVLINRFHCRSMPYCVLCLNVLQYVTGSSVVKRHFIWLVANKGKKWSV